ncbi:hypothetical protein PPROV_001052700 [Pycnococcus provasolii]|uniref:Solute-binding protein family 5 domain-containing protein n=1 Tax=Pycnococcus provasolii TaxID=41880 RepID=A0A830I137_9CHLO|nr:hypothetical protein PPROV_001052700 [Pycnococcus provasolii]
MVVYAKLVTGLAFAFGWALATLTPLLETKAEDDVALCKKMELDFIVLEGDATSKAIEDDIVSDLKKVGITVNTRLLNKTLFNEAMVDGDFNMAFSETWGAPYDPHAYAASWATPDEAYYAALKGLPPPFTQEVLKQKVTEALRKESEVEREDAWTEILTAMHKQATELPISSKRIPAVINKRLTGYTPGHQQFDYPVHTLRVLSGPRSITVAPGAQSGLFSNATGVGRLDAHTYRPNEFFANNWVYDGLVEYGRGGAIIPSLAASWTIMDSPGGGQNYTFNLRKNVTFHDGADWNCTVAKLNFDHVLIPPLRTGDWHGWYGLPEAIEGWNCTDDYTFVVTTKDNYYPFLQELSFIRPLRMMSPNMFVGGLESDPLTQNSCHKGSTLNETDGSPKPIEHDGMTLMCAGIADPDGISGTGRWKYDKTIKDGEGKVQKVHFTVNLDHWDAPSTSSQYVNELVLVTYPTHEAVKAALLDNSLDAVIGAGVLTEKDVAVFKREHADNFAVPLTEPMQNRIVVLNTAKAPTNELQTRKVIIHAVDKDTIIKKELAGLAAPAESLFPKDAPYSGAHLTPRPDYDYEKARLLNCPEPW